MGTQVAYSPSNIDFGAVAPGSSGTLLGPVSDVPLQIGVVVDPVPVKAAVTARIIGDSTHFAVNSVYVYELQRVPIPSWELGPGVHRPPGSKPATQGEYVLVAQSDGVTPISVSPGQILIVIPEYDVLNAQGLVQADMEIDGDTWDTITVPLSFLVAQIVTTVTPQNIARESRGSVNIKVRSVAGPTTEVVYSLHLGPESIGFSMGPVTVPVPAGGVVPASLDIAVSSNVSLGLQYLIVYYSAFGGEQVGLLYLPITITAAVGSAAFVNILLVTDGSGSHVASFGPSDPSASDASKGKDYFGLSELIRTLNAGTSLFNFQVVKAHRNMDPGFASSFFTTLSVPDQILFKPDYQNFSFMDIDLAQFDEIWLFAVGGPGEADWLSEPELAVLSNFMEGGGGIFATGDHANLGLPLCGHIPRVRSMRKWWTQSDLNPSQGLPQSAQPLPGAPLAPSGLGPDRIDTTRAGHDDPQSATNVPVYWFDNQSDDIPQTTTLKMYQTYNPITNTWSSQPHPILFSANGPIDVLPDHMHEGEVILPWDSTLTAANDPNLASAGQAFVEYPAPYLPEIIATGKVFEHSTVQSEYHTVNQPVDYVTAKESVALIGAYDGRQTPKRVGRIVVDSTWHHFFDINLIGDPLAAAPKNLGFEASDAGKAILAKVQSYYTNIAIWLAREVKHAQAWEMSVLYVSRTQPLTMLVSSQHDYGSKEMLQLGAMARQVLARVASPSMESDWLEAYLAATGRKPLPAILDRRVVVEAVLGAAVATAPKENLGKDKDLDAKKSARRKKLHDGVARGIAVLSEQLEQAAADVLSIRDALNS